MKLDSKLYESHEREETVGQGGRRSGVRLGRLRETLVKEEWSRKLWELHIFSLYVTRLAVEQQKVIWGKGFLNQGNLVLIFYIFSLRSTVAMADVHDGNQGYRLCFWWVVKKRRRLRLIWPTHAAVMCLCKEKQNQTQLTAVTLIGNNIADCSLAEHYTELWRGNIWICDAF